MLCVLLFLRTHKDREQSRRDPMLLTGSKEQGKGWTGETLSLPAPLLRVPTRNPKHRVAESVGVSPQLKDLKLVEVVPTSHQDAPSLSTFPA